jgi:L-ascorbate metabolism protein UlaG (beta-lactamase superfamily)
VDAVVISHDHYDHLDYDTVKGLLDRETKWLVPLGVGVHLERWGVPSERVVELDWWEDVQVGSTKLTCTPARHFSGRSIFLADQNVTLWSGWAMQGPEHRVFYSGDTALHPQFDDIGERLGPFDVTMIEVGAYNALWADVHLGPEQAVIAHQLVGGRVLLPVHWGMFDLALHSWTEPMERTVAAAERRSVSVVTPRPGESLELGGEPPPVERWWPDVPWETVEQAPCWSSHVDDLLADRRDPS